MTSVPAAIVAPSRARRRSLLLFAADHAVMLGVATIFLAPFVVVVLTSLMTNGQALSSRLWPHPFRWSNFHDALRVAPLFRYGWNTLQVALLSTAGVVLSSVPVAYALSKLRWRGRTGTLLVILATYMLPVQVVVVPTYIVFAKLHWIGTLKPLIVPTFFGDAFSIFLLRQYFLLIPNEVLDAARVEGAGELSVLTRVVAPLARPAIVAVALFNFIYAWNDFFLPLLYVGENPKLWTLSLGLSEFRTLHGADWNLMMTASTLITLPMIVVFLLAQRALVQGIALRGTARG